MDSRREQILSLLEQHQALSVRTLADELHTSESTVRREAALLEQQGVVQRLYGSIMLNRYAGSVVPLSVRDGEASARKESIARAAAQMVEDNMTVMMDASSTVRRMAKYLSVRKGLTVITNNLRIMEEGLLPNAVIYCTGGLYFEKNRAFTGPAAEQSISKVHADMLFFSSQFLSLQGEISDHGEAETSLRRVMLERADTRVCLMDSGKLGKHGRFTLCTREDVDRILCDAPLPWEGENTCKPTDKVVL